jgi:hypothetical protein
METQQTLNEIRLRIHFSKAIFYWACSLVIGYYLAYLVVLGLVIYRSGSHLF